MRLRQRMRIRLTITNRTLEKTSILVSMKGSFLLILTNRPLAPSKSGHEKKKEAIFDKQHAHTYPC